MYFNKNILRKILFMDARAEKAAIKETIRDKKFGENATEYKEAQELLGNCLRDYRNKRWQEGGVAPEVRQDSANRLLSDLEELNAQLPKKGNVPN